MGGSERAATESEADVLAAVACAVVDEDAADAIPRVLRWAIDVWAAGVDEAPLLVIHDLGMLLLRGRAVRLCGARARPGLPLDEDEAAVLRAARLAFEDRVVVGWLQDPSFLAAHVIVAGLPNGLQERAVAHAISLALGRSLAGQGLPPGNVARLRTLLDHLTGSGRVVDASDLAARTSAQALIGQHDVLLRLPGLLSGCALFSDEDLWELSHLHDVPSEAARLALRTMHRVAATIPRIAPALTAQLRRKSRDVAVDDHTADAFPAGGFDAMSTKGTLENLVRSEVAWVGVGVDDRGAGPPGPDLFDVRFVEGELLYYTRDESPLFEERRALVFVIDEAERLRHKLAELPAQTLVLVLACCLRAHRDLSEVLGPLAVHTVVAVGGADRAVVKEEQGLLVTSLMADIQHRRAAVVDAVDAPPRGRVVFSLRPAPAAMRGPAKARPARLWVRVGAPAWIVDDGTTNDAIEVGTPAGLRVVVDRILLATRG